MKLISTAVALLAILMAHGTDAYGYNESNYYGYDNGQYYTQFNATFGPLTLTALVFGQQTSGTFNSWASRLNCAVNGVAYTGFNCADFMLQNATFSAANGVISSPYKNTANVVVVNGTNPSRGWYTNQDIGQEPSCSLVSDDAYAGPQNNCALGAMSNVEVATYNFAAGQRPLKVTCKNACSSASNSILSPYNWQSLITQLSSFLQSQDVFIAGRFAVSRTANSGSPYVVTRCRFTIPDVAKFPLDICPDAIDPYGSTITDLDTVY